MKLKRPAIKRLLGLQRRLNDIDGHIHSVASPDATLSIREIIQEAKENNLSYIAITDHNTCEGIDKIMRSLGLPNHEIAFSINGVRVVCGAEVTCFYDHSEDCHQKLHILCYGFDRSPSNAFMRLLRDKYTDYMETFFSLPETLVHYSDNRQYAWSYSRNEFKRFVYSQRVMSGKNTHNVYSTEEVVAYFETKGFPAEETTAEMASLSHLVKHKDDLILDVKDVIKAVHRAGGMCMIAHPLKSFKKYSIKHSHNENQRWEYATQMTDTLLRMGIDGVELISNTDSPIKERYNERYKRVGFTSYGSDKHDNSPRSAKLGELKGLTPPCNFKYTIEFLRKKHLAKFRDKSQQNMQEVEQNQQKNPESGLNKTM